jgi:hypothetical protein
MRRFVLHKHSDYGPTHWDLMLETGDVLATWRVEADPLAISPGRQIESTRIHDHRRAYLDYSGQVSGGRGLVARQDAGRLSVTSCDDDLWRFELGGSVLQGLFELRRVADDRWMLRKNADQ